MTWSLKLLNLLNFSHVNIITGSGVVAVSVYKEFHSKIEKTTIWTLPNVRELDSVRDTKSNMGVSKEYLLNLTYGKLRAFTISELFSNNQPGDATNLLYPSTWYLHCPNKVFKIAWVRSFSQLPVGKIHSYMSFE